jgi:hypothetical protein
VLLKKSRDRCLVRGGAFVETWEGFLRSALVFVLVRQVHRLESRENRKRTSKVEDSSKLSDSNRSDPRMRLRVRKIQIDSKKYDPSFERSFDLDSNSVVEVAAGVLRMSRYLEHVRLTNHCSRRFRASKEKQELSKGGNV